LLGKAQSISTSV